MDTAHQKVPAEAGEGCATCDLTPGAFFGFAPGRDGRMANWASICAYLRALAAASPHVRVLELGTTWEGRPLLALAIAAPGVLGAIESIAASQQALRQPSPSGSAAVPPAAGSVPGVAIVLQTCGVHAPEAASAQGAPELATALALRADNSAVHIRERVLFLLVPAVDPDGLDRMHAWLEQSRGRQTAGLPPPGLYRRYAEHDINRDWIMQTQPEIRAIVEGLHARFLPHVVLDMHEMWTHGPRMFLPPYAPPADPSADPEVISRAGRLGAEIAERLSAQGLRGIATGMVFDAFSPARAYVHYHGGVRILSETAGAGLAAGVAVPADRLRPTGGLDPRVPSERQPHPWPGGIWTPADVLRYQWAATWAALEAIAAEADGWRQWQHHVLARAADANRRPGVYVLPEAQPDTAARGELIRVLRDGGLRVDAVPGTGAIVPRAQPFGAWADTLLRPQAYPAVIRAGSLPTPYDVTAHLLPALMGVRCDVLTDAREQVQPARSAPAPLVRLRAVDGVRVWPAMDSDSYRHVLGALSAGQRVWQVEPSPGAEGLCPGGAFVAGNPQDLPGPWRVGARELATPRVGVYAAWKTGSDEGWLRYALDRFQQPFCILRDRDVQSGDFAGCTHLIIPSLRGRDLMRGLPPDRYPPEYTGGLGERGRRQIRDFVARGGRLLAVEASAAWAHTALDLPLADRTLSPSARVFSPGAILAITPHPGPLGFGASPRTWIMYRGGPAFNAPANALAATFGDEPAAAGVAEGVAQLVGAGAVVDVPHHAGRCVLYGFSPYFRGQTWAAFRWLFNALLI